MSTTSPVEIRPERDDDADAIDAIVGDAFLAEFASTSEVALVRTMRQRRELVPSLTLVAVDEGVVVGHIAFSPLTLDGVPSRGLGLGPVAVAPSRQGAGLGSALIVEALQRAEAEGWEFVVLLGHEHYYPRFGFVPARNYGLTGDYGDHDGWMARALSANPPRGHVEYCSAFRE